MEGAKIDYQSVLKINPKNKLAKKELSEIEARLHQKVKWTFERPKSASKLKPKAIKISEKNKPESSNDENNKVVQNTAKLVNPIEIEKEPEKTEPSKNENTENIPRTIELVEENSSNSILNPQKPQVNIDEPKIEG